MSNQSRVYTDPIRNAIYGREVRSAIADGIDACWDQAEGTIADGSITTAKLANGAVTTDKINGGAVTTAKINDGAITNAKLANGAVTANKLFDNAVTELKIANNAVTNAKLDDNAVTNSKIWNNAVTASKIADNSITSAKIWTGAVTTDKINGGAVTTAKINDGAVTEDKLGTDVQTIIASKITNPSGGTSGQVLVKTGDAVAWMDPSATSVQIATKDNYGTVKVDSVNSAGDRYVELTYAGNNTNLRVFMPRVILDYTGQTVQMPILSKYLPTASTSTKGAVVVDSSVTQNSTNPVQSSAIYSALSEKITNPSGGAIGQVLKKTSTGVEWADDNGGGSGSGLIDEIDIDGSALTITNKVVNIPLATSSQYGVIKFIKETSGGGYVVLTSKEGSNEVSASVPLLQNNGGALTVSSSRLPDATSSTKGAVILDANVTEDSVNAVASGAVYDELQSTITTISTPTGAISHDAGDTRSITIPSASDSQYGVVKVAETFDSNNAYATIKSESTGTIYLPQLQGPQGHSSGGLLLSKYLPSATSSTKGAVIVDNEVSDSSGNPVSNSVIKAYVDDAIENVTIQTDSAVTQYSTNPVQSGAVYDAIAAIPSVTLDTAPTQNSPYAVQSGGVYTAIREAINTNQTTIAAGSTTVTVYITPTISGPFISVQAWVSNGLKQYSPIECTVRTDYLPGNMQAGQTYSVSIDITAQSYTTYVYVSGQIVKHVM